MRWRGLELPTNVVFDKESLSSTYGKSSIEPFERGFGVTVGNSLRRILLSSLEGSAVTSLKFKGVQHEFSSIQGVMEDVTNIVLNIKSLVVQLEDDEPKNMSIVANSAGVITAADIKADAGINIFNPDQVIATLTDDVDFEIEMHVEKGRGYVPATEDTDDEEREIGLIALDAAYSPVTRVRYNTEETRVGQLINYDRLIMEIWTDGTITPEMALVESAKVLRKHLGPFIQYSELGDDFAPEEDIDTSEWEGDDSEEDIAMKEKLSMPLQQLDLSVRANNCLEMAEITTIGQLAQMKESDILALRSFGQTSLNEIKKKFAELGLELGMDVSQYLET